MRWITVNAVAVADALALLRFDHAGSLYHRLLASAKYDGSFYTNNVSAMLLARLALTEDIVDWSDADALAKLRIVDPACGTGTLLMAAMHAVRDRHEHSAGAEADSDPLHLALVEDVLYGLDINRHGIQLAALQFDPRESPSGLQPHESIHHAARPATQWQGAGRIVGIPGYG